jgi:hypothetical protein
MAAPIRDEVKQVNHRENFTNSIPKISNIPRECPTMVTRVASCLAIAVLTADRMGAAVLEIPFQSEKFSMDETFGLLGLFIYKAAVSFN